MFSDATNILGASYMHIYIYFVKTIIVLYSLSWRFSDRYILIKIITKYLFIPFKNTKLLLIFNSSYTAISKGEMLKQNRKGKI